MIAAICSLNSNCYTAKNKIMLRIYYCPPALRRGHFCMYDARIEEKYMAFPLSAKTQKIINIKSLFFADNVLYYYCKESEG